MQKAHQKTLQDIDKRTQIHNRAKAKYQEFVKQTETAIMNYDAGKKESLPAKSLKAVNLIILFIIFYIIHLFFCIFFYIVNFFLFIFLYCSFIFAFSIYFVLLFHISYSWKQNLIKD